ncbi:MAG TPA: class I SAM-dependent methyltransferase [Candidatus Elarobacter sp.]|jgi:SAM-dependent methyltransferase|nr:class I SAM-dependent methyltransferase [Candidatus Elarobacter sp.]
MPDAHYENPRIAELYDLGNPWSVDRDFYLSLAGAPRRRILDLGCGTGLLCDAFAALNHDVTGVDPSPAMIESARRKPHGKDVEWVQSFAQTYRSDKRFDLIIMTGHAFQVLLEDADVRATLATMRKHLEPDGLVAFESRNPAIDWAARWNYDKVLDSPNGTVRESRRFIAMDGDRMRFELRYTFPDETLVSKSELRFVSRTEIENDVIASGLHLDNVLGNWNGEPFDENLSDEMIFIARCGRPNLRVRAPETEVAVAERCSPPRS